MAFPKYKPPLPPKNKIIKEIRIVDGKSRYVETFNGKVVRVFDDDGNVVEDRSAKFGDKLPPLPVVKPRPKIDQTKIEQEEQKEDNSTISQQASSETGSGLQLIPKEEVARKGDITPKEDNQISCPGCKGANIEPTLYLENSTRYKCKDCSETFVKDKYIDKDTAPKPEETTIIPKPEETTIIPKPEETTTTPKPEEIVTTPKSEEITTTPKPENIIKPDTTTPETTTYIPKIEPIIPKIEPIIPKIDIPKEVPKTETVKIEVPKLEIQINDQKKAQNIVTPGKDIKMMNRLNKIVEEKTKLEPQKAEIPKEAPKPEQIKTKKLKEVRRFMAEEDMQEIMQERKFEEWLKKHKFNESVNKMAELAEENQEKIKGISDEVTDVKKNIGNVENRIDTLKEGLTSVLGETKKPITETLGELCTGVDCIKEDVKKYQDTQSELDKKLDSRFTELRERVQKLEEPTFMCDNCGQDGIRALSSYCPNCGSPIHEWYDDTGQPIKGWAPHWKRSAGRQSA